MHKILKSIIASSFAMSLALAGSAIAVPLAGSTATIDTDLGVTFAVGSGPCKSGNAVSVVGAGVELGSGAYTGGCSGLVTVDISDTQVVLGGVREFGIGDYRWMTIVMDFVGAGPITSVSLVSQNLFQAGTDIPTPIISFDADTISLTWDSISSPAGIFEILDGGSAVFSVNASAVPVPGSLALLGIGLAALGFRRKKPAV